MFKAMTRIVLIDDHQLVREGLRALLEKHPGFEIVGEATNGRDGIRVVRQHRPDIVIMDVAMPDLNGIDATSQILRFLPDATVIGLSMHADGRYVERMISAGAKGYLLKHRASTELIEAIERIGRGKRFLSPGCELPENYRSTLEPSSGHLSVREREILQLLAEGHSNKGISELLSISVKTVQTHQANIRDKLGISSIAELTKFAIKEGLTSL